MDKKLTADLNVVANSNLEIEFLDGDLNIIQKLDDEPNDVGGLTSAQLKAKFDESGNIIKEYINKTLIPAILSEDATEEGRKEAEIQRETNETARQTYETARQTAEQERATAEQGRISAERERAAAESSRAEAEAARQAAEQARTDENTGIVARATAQANAAAGSAENAAASAGTAQESASIASSQAAAAGSFASSASASEAAAAESSASANNASMAAQSWAVGGTGTRDGEDTNNAKYWSEQAKSAAGGDFATKAEAKGYVDTHNQSTEAHSDIRAALATHAAQHATGGSDPITPESIGAAVSGGGVMERAAVISVASADETYDSFCPKVDAVLATMPNKSVRFVIAYPPGWYGAGNDIAALYKADSNYASLKSIGSYNYAKPDGFMMIKRVGTWDPLEYIDPPMEVGVEYRTTERYLGKPVYVKVVDCGVAPNNTEATVLIKDSGGDTIPVNRFVSINSICYADSNHQVTVPMVNNDIITCLHWSGDAPQIYIKTTTSSLAVNGYHVIATIKYTKTTD